MRRSCGAAAVLLWAALPVGMGFPMLLRRSGTPCCSIGLARGPGSTWVLAETRARRAGKSPAPTCLHASVACWSHDLPGTCTFVALVFSQHTYQVLAF